MDPDAYDIFVFHPEVPWSASQEDSETEESNSEAYSDLEISKGLSGATSLRGAKGQSRTCHATGLAFGSRDRAGRHVIRTA